MTDPRVQLVADGYDSIALVEAAGLANLRDEVVTFVEPNGPAQFHWILARK